jgi:hypothetical protein
MADAMAAPEPDASAVAESPFSTVAVDDDSGSDVDDFEAPEDTYSFDDLTKWTQEYAERIYSSRMDPVAPPLKEEFDSSRMERTIREINTSAAGRGIWTRELVYKFLEDADDRMSARGYSVLGTVQTVYTRGIFSNSWNSCTLSWIAHLDDEHSDGMFLRRTGFEIAYRYFSSVDVDSGEVEGTAIHVRSKLRALIAFIEKAYEHNKITWADAVVEGSTAISNIRVDLIVVMGLMLPPSHKGKNMSAKQAVYEATKTVEYLPAYMHIGAKVSKLPIAPVELSLEWFATGDEGHSNLRTCNFNAGYAVVPPLVYNSGVGMRSTGYALKESLWLTLYLSEKAMNEPVFHVLPTTGGEKRERVGDTLFEVIAKAQSVTWYTNKTLGSVSVTVNGITYKCCVNNLSVLDIGVPGRDPDADLTMTYGPNRVGTIRMFAEPAATKSPIAPSIQVFHGTSGIPEHVALDADHHGGRIVFPLLLDPKALSVVPVLMTIISKLSIGVALKTPMSNADEVTRRDARLYLSSRWGLQSPKDIVSHIDFLIGQIANLRDFLRILPTLEQAEKDEMITASNSNVEASFGAGIAADALRSTHMSFGQFMADKQNAMYSYSYAWSVVQSSIMMIWLTHCLIGGVTPVPLPLTMVSPFEGIGAAKQILQYTIAQWVRWDDADEDEHFYVPTLKALTQLANAEGKVAKSLSQCHKMIWDSLPL